jgi:hypothetical protein
VKGVRDAPIEHLAPRFGRGLPVRLDDAGVSDLLGGRKRVCEHTPRNFFGIFGRPHFCLAAFALSELALAAADRLLFQPQRGSIFGNFGQ